MNSPDLLRQQQWGAQQKAQLDEKFGVGPWGQSMLPQAQPMRNMFELAERDPQAYNRLQAQVATGAMPNPFEEAGSGGGSGGSRSGFSGGGSGGGNPLQRMTSVRPPSTLTGTAPVFKGAKAIDPYESVRGMNNYANLPAKPSKRYFNPFT